MITPFFVETIYRTVKGGIDMLDETARFWIMLIGVIIVFCLTVMSVTTLVHNPDTPEQYCTTMLGERTSCNKK